MTAGFYCQQRTGCQVLPGLEESFDHGGSNGIRQQILRTNLDDARATHFAGSEQRPKIRLVSEHNEMVFCGVRHNLGVRCLNRSYGRPVHSRGSILLKKLNPGRAQIHVNQSLYADGSGNSISLTRHAA
jgi:hypothetical protein